MSNIFTRRSLVVFGVPLGTLYAQEPAPSWLPTEDPMLIREMVGVSHRDLKRVRAIAEQNPALVRAAIDWGFGDWETALGAASHVGNREIAQFLLENGAAPTIFSAAMLGQLEVVQAMVKAEPGVQRRLGPHGITLLAHAKAGGEQAGAVVQYLTEMGDAGIGLPRVPLTSAEREAVVGKYAFGSGLREQCEINAVKEQLGILRAGAPGRQILHHEGGLVFYPAGAPAAKISFQLEAGVVTGFKLGALRARRI